MEATIGGARIFYLPVGPEDGYPLIVLHGGPGMDHTVMHPWLDILSDTFRLIYVDLRGNGRSERVDPATLTLQRLAEDVTMLSTALGLKRYALLGHSYGAFVALAHAVEWGTASHYIISSGSASMSKSMLEVEGNLANFEPMGLREQVMESWDREPLARTQEDVAELLRMQMPFHFATVESMAYQRYMALETANRAVYAPEVLAYVAVNGYEMEYEEQLAEIDKPTLVLAGEYDRLCTPRAAQDLHDGIADSELVVIPDAAHMTYIEQPGIYSSAVRRFFSRFPIR